MRWALIPWKLSIYACIKLSIYACMHRWTAGLLKGKAYKSWWCYILVAGLYAVLVYIATDTQISDSSMGRPRPTKILPFSSSWLLHYWHIKWFMIARSSYIPSCNSARSTVLHYHDIVASAGNQTLYVYNNKDFLTFMHATAYTTSDRPFS